MAKTSVALRRVRSAANWASLLLFLFVAGQARAQTHPTVCAYGSGSFEAAFGTGVSVEVGAARRDGLATRLCQGTLLWDQRSLVVATGAAQVDIDAFGINIGLGMPVVTFEVKQADADCCSTFLIYSLQKPPKLLRTITGGSSYRAADSNLNGTTEIWTNDVLAMQGFESSMNRKMLPAPVVVLRFRRGRLADAGPEFQPHFDEEIASTRAGLSAEDLEEFKNSDGRLASTVYFSEEEERRSERLQRTKATVLKIVWSYLYSGREAKAWSALAEMWPPGDLERIRAEISSVRASGILAHVESAPAKASPPAANIAKVFDLRAETSPPPEFMGRRRVPAPVGPSVVPPQPILLNRSLAEGQSEKDFPESELLELIVDAAGKVHSVQPAQPPDPNFTDTLKNDAAGWKFVPAMNQGQPVASRMFLVISPKR